MRVRWTLAAADLQSIKDYLTERYPHLAESTVVSLYEGMRSLRASPHRGRAGRLEGTRELIFGRLPYIAAYRVKERTIEVLHI
jgi:toxin ParE1/3/4